MTGLDAGPIGDASCGYGEAMTCPGCQHQFNPVGRQRCCSKACRVAVYRRRREAAPIPAVATRSVRGQPVAVYACDHCGARAVGEKRRERCRAAMRMLGLGGCCPSCEEPVAVDELLGQEVIA